MCWFVPRSSQDWWAPSELGQTLQKCLGHLLSLPLLLWFLTTVETPLSSSKCLYQALRFHPGDVPQLRLYHSTLLSQQFLSPELPSFPFRPSFSVLPFLSSLPAGAELWVRTSRSSRRPFRSAAAEPPTPAAARGVSLRGRAARGEEAAGSERGPGREGP